MPKTLLFGATGQLGRALLGRQTTSGLNIGPVSRRIDLEDARSLASIIERERPDWVISAAAMTDVDAAHLEPGRALTVNGLAPGIIARAAEAVGARVIHISSEAVFEGSQQQPYREEDPCRPVSVYGASKLTGDQLVLLYSPSSFVLRTSWLYSEDQGTNFPTRILAQLADPQKQLSVVTDVIGNPTPTRILADAIAAVIATPPDPGLYHVCCQGAASKFDWAVAIAGSAGFDAARISPVTSNQYPTVALRPKLVHLNCDRFLTSGVLSLPNWRDAWRGVNQF